MTTETFSLMTLNGSGPHDGPGSAIRRKRAIHDVVTLLHPDLIFVQELGVRHIQGEAWKDKKNKKTKKCKDYSLPKEYIYTGNKDRGIIYNEDRITLNSKTFVYEAIDKGLEYCHRRDSKTTLEERISRKDLSEIGFNVNDPRDRMCARWFTLTSTEREADILCISWHGWSNERTGGSMLGEKKKKLFKYNMEFLWEVKEIVKLPFIIAGDYNIKKGIITDYLPDHFSLDAYNQSGRRERKPIDYFISYGVEVKNVHGIHWEEATAATEPNKILDHDPVKGIINLDDLKVIGKLSSQDKIKSKELVCFRDKKGNVHCGFAFKKNSVLRVICSDGKERRVRHRMKVWRAFFIKTDKQTDDRFKKKDFKFKNVTVKDCVDEAKSVLPEYKRKKHVYRTKLSKLIDSSAYSDSSSESSSESSSDSSSESSSDSSSESSSESSSDSSSESSSDSSSENSSEHQLSFL